MRVRKKPVIIDAVQVALKGMEWPAWLETAIAAGVVYWQGGDSPYYSVETHHGIAYAKVGDWLMRGVDGEIYPCRDDVFERMYERAE